MASNRVVVIDGVRYLPADVVLANQRAIVEGLLASFWGDCSKLSDAELCEVANTVCVRVYDDGDGEPIDAVLSAIAKAAQRIAT